MGKCRYFIAIKQDSKRSCDNCKRWTGKRCRDEQKLRELYEDSNEFKFFDRMMRSNKGVYLD